MAFCNKLMNNNDTHFCKKSYLFFLLCLLTGLQFRCYKDEIVEDPNAYSFELKALFSSTAGTLPIGDTLTIRIQLPDTITAKNYLNQERTEKVEIVNEATFAYFLHTVDPVDQQTHFLSLSKPEHNLFDYFKVVITEGQPLNDIYTLGFKTNAKPYTIILNLIARKKGVFFFYFYPGKFFINQTFKGKYLIVPPPDRHLEIVANSTTYPNWLKDVEMIRKTGIQTYAFKVE